MPIIDPTKNYSDNGQSDRTVPPGIYAVTVSYIAMKPGPKGPYYNVGLKIDKGEYEGSMVWEIMSTSAAMFCVRKLATFAKACNFMHRFDPVADEMKFRKGVKDSLIQIEVEAEIDDTGEERSRVASFSSLAQPIRSIDPKVVETEGDESLGDDDDFGSEGDYDEEEVPF